MTDGPIRIACFGDSLTEGYGLAPDEALPVVLETMLRSEGVHAKCLNHGISGDTSEDGLERLNDVLDAAPNAVLVEFGANDFYTSEPIATVRANLSAIIETLLRKRLPILLIGISVPDGFDDEYKAEFDPLFKELADKYELPLFPDILSCYFGNNDMTLLDGMHPNALGVRAIAKGLLPQTQALIDTLD